MTRRAHIYSRAGDSPHNRYRQFRSISKVASGVYDRICVLSSASIFGFSLVIFIVGLDSRLAS